jgi:hypothetical protein
LVARPIRCETIQSLSHTCTQRARLLLGRDGEATTILFFVVFGWGDEKLGQLCSLSMQVCNLNNTHRSLRCFLRPRITHTTHRLLLRGVEPMRPRCCTNCAIFLIQVWF